LGERDWFLIAKIQKTAHPHKQKPDKLEKLDELEGWRDSARGRAWEDGRGSRWTGARVGLVALGQK